MWHKKVYAEVCSRVCRLVTFVGDTQTNTHSRLSLQSSLNLIGSGLDLQGREVAIHFRFPNRYV